MNKRRQIEQLKSILDETDDAGSNGHSKVAEQQAVSPASNGIKTSYKTGSKSILADDNFGGPAIKLEDFNSDDDDFTEKITESRNEHEELNGSGK